MLYTRPTSKEYPSFYATYVDDVPEGDILEILRSQIFETVGFLSSLAPDLASHRYEEGKWSIAEVLGHMADSERVFAYRALRMSRGDQTALPGYEQDDYVAGTDFSKRSIASLASEFQAIRTTTLFLLENLTEEEIMRTGTASGGSFTVGSHAYIIAGHEKHHMDVLKKKYV